MVKQTVNINFAEGMDTKTDPWQLAIGKFARLVNMIFQKGKRLQKRNGYAELSSLDQNNSYITTLNNNLVSVGNTVSAYASSVEKWVTKGTLQPCSLSVLPLIRNNLNQTACDSAVSNNMVCTVFTETNITTSATVTQHLYAVADATTGQNIIKPTAIPALSTSAISGSSRVFVVGNYFVIVSETLISSTSYLQYVSIPINNPINLSTNVSNASAAQNIYVEAYVPITSNPGWDGCVTNNTLVVAYNTTAGAQGVHVVSLTEALIASNSASGVIHNFANAAYIGAIVSVCVDSTVSPNIVYISFWNNATTDGYTCAVYLGFGIITVQFAPQKVISTVVISNLASAAQNNSCLVFSEVVNAYSYDSGVPSNYIDGVTVSSAGAVGSPYVVVRSVGLASKAFIIDSKIYFLSAFKSPFQPSYFLIEGSSSTSALPIITAKLAYQNGGGYLALGLPNVTIASNVASISYLYKDDVEALNTLNNPQQTTAGGIYSQTGINLINFTLGTTQISTSEIANNLHISGGYLSHFDGYMPVEHNFFLFPDSVELAYTANSVKTPTGTASNGSTSIVLSSATGVYAGMTISDTTNPTYITAGTTILTISGTTAIMSTPAAHAISGDTLSIQGNIEAVPSGGAAGLGAYYYQVTYEWTDNQGLAYRSRPSIPVTYTSSGSATTGIVIVSVPTLRLTAKIANAVKIVVYRWSTHTQVYNQVTSIAAPVLNDTTIDSVQFVDTLADASIIGNNIIYTTGGVTGNTNAPATNLTTLFDTRVISVLAEDPNTLIVSKQVVPNTPVEFSLGYTIYVAPNIGTTSSTGPITSFFPMDDKIILFKKSAMYYINGVGPDNLGTTATGCSLGNYSQPIFITSAVGCTNQSSIVLTPDGLMFQSDKGIWLLNRGLGTSYVGDAVEDFNSFTVNSTVVIPLTNFVLFTLNNNITLMFDYYYKQWGIFEGPYAISSCIYNGLHTILDKYGRVLQETPGEYLDVDSPVLMSLTTSWFNLASLQGYQRFYDFYILARYLSPHLMQCQVAYNYNSSIVHQKIFNPNLSSSATPSSFGVPVPLGTSGDLEQWKIDAKQQLCQSFQLTINEVFDPSQGVVAGAGFAMSGLAVRVGIKAGTRPIRGANTAGVS